MKLHPLARLVINEPHLIVSHLKAYVGLVRQEAGKVSTTLLTRVAFFAAAGVLAVLGWATAIEWPAAIAGDASSLVGWGSGALAIMATARFVAHGVIYVRASQWFDQMAPWAVGFCRRAMYRLSDNPDFLDSADPKRREKEKSIY